MRMAEDLVAGKLAGKDVRQSVAGPIDDGSIPQVLRVIRARGIPSLLVVYFPGVDIDAHGSPDPLPSQVEYLEKHIDPDAGAVLAEYSKRSVLDSTYVIFTADHGHTPVLRDHRHDLGSSDNDALVDLLRRIGLRVRHPGLKLSSEQRDYQAVVAEEGFSAYVYLANRSLCRNRGERCEWAKPPRFSREVMPVLRAIYSANRSGRRVRRLKGTIDLIFARDYSSEPGRTAPPFEIFDGKRLVPIAEYLARHPRPDLVEVERRMKWLGEGPYGDRAGDIVILANAGLLRPIQDRYYFSIADYYAWHGSMSRQDSHIPLVVARSGASGDELKRRAGRVLHDPPSALDVTPLIESLLGGLPAAHNAP